nr:flavin-containing monooxygenase 3-like [Gorilla gorilla gorilla]
MFKHVFPPQLEEPTLAFTGILRTVGATISTSEVQSCWAVCVFKGMCTVKTMSGAALDSSSPRLCYLTHDVLYQTDLRGVYIFLKPHLLNKKAMLKSRISFLGLNKLLSVSDMMADVRKKRKKLEKIAEKSS